MTIIDRCEITLLFSKETLKPIEIAFQNVFFILRTAFV